VRLSQAEPLIEQLRDESLKDSLRVRRMAFASRGCGVTAVEPTVKPAHLALARYSSTKADKFSRSPGVLIPATIFTTSLESGDPDGIKRKVWQVLGSYG